MKRVRMALRVLAGVFGVLAVSVVLTAVILAIGLLIHAEVANASAGPGWSLRSLAQPASFQPGGSDRYLLLVTNAGGGPTAPGDLVTISDTLPRLVHAAGEPTVEDMHTEGRSGCSAVPVRCVVGGLAAGDTLLVTIPVTVEAGARAHEECSVGVVAPEECNIASVSGGGAPAAASAQRTAFAPEPPPFGIEHFAVQAFEEDGSASTQAGGHPATLASSLDFTSEASRVGEQIKDVIVDLPPGLVGNPQSLPKCPLNELLINSLVTACPPASRIGTIVYDAVALDVFRASEAPTKETTAIYNMQPEPGFPAEFAFTAFGKAVYMYASAVRIDGQLRLRVTLPGIPELGTISATLLFYGNPGEHFGEASSPVPFFTSPVDCAAGPLSATVEVDTWENPATQHGNVYPHFAEYTTYPQLSGCSLLQFQPAFMAQPDTTQADEPSGYSFTVANPQDESPFQLGTPELKDATVTLPPGVSLNPSAADGLRGCAATGPEGIDIGEGQTLKGGVPGAGEDVGDREATEAGEGHPGGSDPSSPYDDGLYHTAPGHCPAASTIGTVEVQTPLLPSPLQGHVYVAMPECGGGGQPPCTEEAALALPGRPHLFGVYLEAAGAGTIVKLAGEASVNPVTGQITTRFRENPQLPFSALRLHLNGGPRAPLANPQACGPASTAADFSAWSSPQTLDSQVLAHPFTVDWNGAGEGCPATPPLAPSLIAETTDPAAGSFSPFTLTLSRGDRQQYLSRLSVTMPPGLLAMISSVTPCGEPQAAAGTCSEASRIGTATAAAGAGSHPYWVTGNVYLTGAYNGAPFGLSIVVPAQAGPFNLGNVVVRSAITVNPVTGAVTVTSGPLPQIVDGIPLRVQTINVNVNREGFVFNPTSCVTRQVGVTVTGAQGAQAQVSSPFAAAGCKSLPFAPAFTASTQARTSKEHGASLNVKVAYHAHQANIRSVAVTLPKQLPARLTTIQQACLAATFEANPAACPAGSLIGVVRASTPVLPGELSGPAYLVSYGGAAFPNVVVIVQGDGVRVDLTGNINIAAKTEVTSSTFANLPDVPISSFEFNLPEGPHSALATDIPSKDRGNLCGIKLAMPTTIAGQNGDVIKQSTKVSVSGCPKSRKKARTRARKQARSAGARQSHRGMVVR